MKWLQQKWYDVSIRTKSILLMGMMLAVTWVLVALVMIQLHTFSERSSVIMDEYMDITGFMDAFSAENASLEAYMIEPCDGGAHYTEDGGESWVDLPGDTPVSMNLWGFGKSFLDEAEQRFAGWLTENLPVNPLKCEYFLPLVVTELIEENKAKIQVLRSTDKWYGVTYREDKPLVVEAIARKTAEGQYPENLWA